jgi:hypothetical protein
VVVCERLVGFPSVENSLPSGSESFTRPIDILQLKVELAYDGVLLFDNFLDARFLIGLSKVVLL